MAYSPKLRLKSRKSKSVVASNMVTRLLLIAAILLALAYIIWQALILISPPDLRVDYPAEGQVLSSGYVDVTGYSDPNSEISIDGRTVLVDEDGSFAYALVLSEGVHSIEVSSKSRFGRTSIVEITVLVEDDISIPVPDEW
ncbi:MAG: hypothetical protein WDZ42_02070 [Candidatus Saccharimonadales bacterium]